VSIYNPSNLDLATGDLRLFSQLIAVPFEIDVLLVAELQLQRSGAIVGTALMPNLTLNMGNNTILSTSAFDVWILKYV
jgi:hypothetical protein